jgi:hypothetical protein
MKFQICQSLRLGIISKAKKILSKVIITQKILKQKKLAKRQVKKFPTNFADF